MKKLLAIAFVAAFVMNGCAKKQQTQVEDNALPTAAGADENWSGDSDSGKAGGLQTIHFAYDSFLIDDANKSILNANAKILKDKSSIKIQVEGHCDQRGGIQYNLALGEKRANAVKKYLVAQGVSKSRLSVISFGKEKPIDPAETEEAYAKNRRANFAITSK